MTTKIINSMNSIKEAERIASEALMNNRLMRQNYEFFLKDLEYRNKHLTETNLMLLERVKELEISLAEALRIPNDKGER